MERNGNKVLLTVIGIAVLIVATVGATFAYFSATGGTAEQQVTTGELKVSATSTVADNVSIKPTTWTSATDADSDSDIAKVGLTVVTDGTTISTGKYDIKLTTTGIALNAVEGKTGGNLSEVKWALYDTGSNTEVGKGDFTSGNVSGEKINLANDGASITIPAGPNTDSYKLYIWIEDTTTVKQDQLQGLTITAKLTVDAVQ